MALQTLSLARNPEWEDILYVDLDIINEMALWLITQHDQSTGAFVPKGEHFYDYRIRVGDDVKDLGIMNL